MKVPVTKFIKKSSRKTEKVPVTIYPEKLKNLAKSAENTFSTLKMVKIALFII